MKKTYTFLITSNRKGKTKTITLSSSLLKVIGIFSVATGVLVASMMVDYVSLLLEVGENKRLKAENESLKKQFEIVESKINSLENSLERVKSFSTKLKLITDVDSEDRNLNLAMGKTNETIGGGDVTPLPEEDPVREPAARMGAVKDVLLGERLADSKAGELLRLDLENYETLSIRIDQKLKTSRLVEQGVMDLYKRLSQKNSLLTATPTLKPTKGWYTAKFGYRMDPYSGNPVMHNGVDIAAPEGTPVIAPADGVVAHIGYENNGGKVLTIDHGYGLKTKYAHNSQIFVEIGQKVTKKEMIAAVGSTGRSQGPHLYYEIQVHGIPVDPLTYIIE